MPRTSGHITEQRTGVYRIRVSAGTNPITGKRRQLSQTVHGTRDDAERALQTLLRDVQNAPGAPRTFDELWCEWNDITVTQRKRKRTTSYSDRGIYNNHIAPSLGQMHPAHIRPGDLNALYDRLLITLSPASVRKVHQQIGAVLQYGCRREYIERNVARLAEGPQVPRRYPHAPKPDDLNEVLDHMYDHDQELWLIYRLLAIIGVRRNELPALRYGDIDITERRIRIHSSVDVIVGEGLELADTKTGPAGHGALGLDDELFAVLQARRRTMLEDALGTGVPIDDILIFPSTDLTTPRRPDSFSNRARRYLDRYQHLPRITLRHLRAFVATELEHDGHGLATAQAALRHVSEATTARYYVAARADTARDLTRTIGHRLQRGHRLRTSPSDIFLPSS